ncbi:ATP-binding protein [Inquilinus sp. Marseille-Q2685]|uniref:sensor histidine kinase n=1 Tax=Inquilinus sp. Marseille-Q2685 TaxID=2866581 RepID=UPI001CE475B8|nr:ATP-binding protein [Inquilinus sp. Marseille-Q2685]
MSRLPMNVTARRGRILLFAAVGLAAAGLSLAVQGWVLRDNLAALEGQARERLTLAAASVEAAIGRFRYLPQVIGQTPQIRALYGAPPGPAAIDTANRHLQAISGAAGAAALYVLDRDGTAIAASNWDTPGSFIGHGYAYRPYYREAIETGEGSFYGIGATTGQPGYFLASRIDAPGPGGRPAPVGIAVVKVDLTGLEREWAGADATLGIADADGILFLAARPGWRYRPLFALDGRAQASILAERRYAGLPSVTRPIFRSRTEADDQGRSVRLLDPGAGGDLLLFTLPLPDHGWSLIAVADPGPARTNALVAAAAAGLAVIVVVLAAVLWRARRRARIAERRSKDELERRVAERTEALTAANRRLEDEIEERRRAEAELHRTRDDLVQAAKLAALGQAFAGLAHEINQPLAALKTYLASTRLLSGRGETAKVAANIDVMAEAVDRVAGLTGQLKRLARRDGHDSVPVDLAAVLDGVLRLLAYRLADLGIAVERTGDGPAVVMGEAGRLDQVVMNLVSNAIDAVRGRETRRIRAVVETGGGTARLTVEDSGPGIDPAIRDRLFEPFVTTKEAGDGLGLGLATVYRIVRDHGGGISHRPSDLGGTAFVVTLPLAEAKTVAE